jgi:hypothetical protein
MHVTWHPVREGTYLCLALSLFRRRHGELENGEVALHVEPLLSPLRNLLLVLLNLLPYLQMNTPSSVRLASRLGVMSLIDAYLDVGRKAVELQDDAEVGVSPLQGGNKSDEHELQTASSCTTYVDLLESLLDGRARLHPTRRDQSRFLAWDHSDLDSVLHFQRGQQ